MPLGRTCVFSQLLGCVNFIYLDVMPMQEEHMPEVSLLGLCPTLRNILLRLALFTQVQSTYLARYST